MLILQRRHKQKIYIGDNIVISVFLPNMGGKLAKYMRWVKVGIDAPKSVKVLRAELDGTSNKNKNNTSKHGFRS